MSKLSTIAEKETVEKSSPEEKLKNEILEPTSAEFNNGGNKRKVSWFPFC